MPETSLVKRLETLENAVNGPNGLTRQIAAVAGELKEFREEFLQFRDWTRGEFSAVRQEMATGFAAVRQEMAAGLAAVRAEMAAGLAAVREEMATEFAAVRQEMAAGLTAVRQEMATEFAVVRQEMATRSEMRMLHEEVIARLAVLQEGQVRRKQSPRSPKRP